MKKLILVTGDLASGKTRYSNLLSEKYSIPIIHKDPIKEVLGDTIGFSNREENKKLSEASRQLMALFMEEYLKTGENLIMESNFRKEEIDRLTLKAGEFGYSTLVLCLQADVKVLHARYVERITKEHRHPVHQSTTFDIFEDFKAYVEGSRENLTGNVINIDANDFDYQKNCKILEEIERFLAF